MKKSELQSGDLKNQDSKKTPEKKDLHHSSHGQPVFDVNIEAPGSYGERQEVVSREIENDPGIFEN
jgi:hypothetical protein